MRSLPLLLASLCASVSMASSARRAPVLRSLAERGIPITEDTPMPGTSSSLYSLCVTLDISAFRAQILDDSNECAVKTSYDWTGTALPTAAERRELCSCTALIATLERVKVPRCSLYRDGSLVSYAQVVQYAFGLCSSSDSGGTTTPATISETDDSATSPSANTAGDDEEEEATSKAGLIVGVILGVVVVVAIVAFAAYKFGRRRRAAGDAAAKEEADDEDGHGAVEATPLSPLDGSGDAYVAISPATTTKPAYPITTGKAVTSVRSAELTVASTGGTGASSEPYIMRPSEGVMWDDPALLAVRVPYDTIFFGPLLSRGGYGEVYKGTYKGETVAIKQLLPDRRKDLAQIDAFLSEIKLMSTLEHERIVRFIGVAWNALSDVCVLVEYMENGDLRSVLTRWDRIDNRPRGFDKDKVTIALHVAHALTYLHSLQPVVVHRDLKSKNILLDARCAAKLTDFGVSRERADATMTANVGSSLWMAPEVMLGERYDEKADVFSFGVVLSELDTQRLPYEHAKETGTDRKVPDSAILQMVSLGRLQVAFTETAHPDLVNLGRDCVQLDAKQRPTSAEVLHRVHQVLRTMQ